MRKSIVGTAALAATLSLPAAAQTCAPFTDVPASHLFCADIQWMRSRNVTLGCTATTFCPSQFVTREQMAATCTG